MDRVACFPTSSLAGRERFVELSVGDVTATETPVDLLCVSAIPNDYTPVPHGVLGALDTRGIRVAQLAADKAHDWRSVWQCWVSAPLDHPIRRILCFEHAWAVTSGLPTDAPELVGNVFRAIRELVLSDAPLEAGAGDQVLERVRIPLLAAGDQGADHGDMLEATIRQAYLSLVGQLPVRRVEIVLHHSAPDLHQLLVRAGRAFEQVRAEWAERQLGSVRDFDYFISYRHQDADRVNPVVDAMRALEPGLRLFIDREQLSAGRYWKADLMSGLARSERALCFITDSYPDSPECMDEFHASLCIARERPDGFLRPLLRLTARQIERLPVSVRRVHCIDASAAHLAAEDVARRALAGR
jgi:hypothetical protein